MAKKLVLDAHTRNINIGAKIREHRKANTNVPRASLEQEKTKPVLASDVNVRDLVTTADLDRGNGWSSQKVLEISIYENSLLTT